MMQKSFLRRFAAAAVCGALSFGVLTACEQKQVTLDGEEVLNFQAPAADEEVAVITIKDYGDVKIRLFPDECPKGVENFKTLIQNGYYDELIFHRVVDNFVIQGGDPTGSGSGGDDCWKSGGFEQTISPKLRHFVGAVAYAVAAQDKLNNSQFYIVTGEQINEDYIRNMEQNYGKAFTPAVKNLYYIYGGQPFLDDGYEVFGQVFDGLEYCLDVQKVPVNGSSKPLSSVVIEKAQIVKYDGTVDYRNCQGEPITPAQ